MSVESTVAVLALLVAVAGLWFQFSSLRAQLTVQNFSQYNQRYQQVVAAFPPEVLDEDFDLAALPAQEVLVLGRTFWSYFDLCLEEYHLHSQQLISPAVWRMWESGIRAAMSRPAFRQGWALVNTVTSYADTPGFVAMMEGFLAADDGPPAHT